MFKTSPKNFILRVLQGLIIGAGAILPGISGGVLAVIFGIYRPMMESIAHPKTALRRHLPTLAPIGIGWLAGFLGGSGLIFLLFNKSETVATCLFIGLILGTLPSLWRDAGEQGRSKADYGVCALCFLALSALLLYVQYGALYEMPANFFGFLFCGVLWGLSFIVPGMTSSSILMAVGLLTPMVAGISSFDFAVLIPWGLGMGGSVLLLARAVDKLFKTRYALFSHAVVGVVLASTVAIIPFRFADTKEMILCAVCAVAGLALALWSSGLQVKD